MFTCQKCLSNQGHLIDFPDQTIKIEQWPVQILVCTNEDKSRNQYTYLHFLPGWLFFFLNTYLLRKILLNINTWYMTNSTLVSPVKMEYGWNFSIFGLKMMMKSGLGKIFLKFLHALTMSKIVLNASWFLGKV